MAGIISLTGDLGSGKSTVSSILCKHLNYDYIYTGEIQRRIAERYNMTTTELNKYSEQHPEIDEEIDNTFKSLKDAKNLIVDSRLAWFFIPNSFKIFLKTNIIVSAERISNDKVRKSEQYSSKEDAKNKIIERKNSENKRYMEFYGANCANLNNFDLIVDTSFITPQKVAEIIICEFERWLNSTTWKTKTYISPKNLFPTKPINQIIAPCLTDSPIKVTSINHFDFIIEGHSKVSNAIQNSCDLITVEYTNDTDLSSLKCDTVKNYTDWEEFNSFKFLIYP